MSLVTMMVLSTGAAACSSSGEGAVDTPPEDIILSGSETYVPAEVPANALDLVGLSEDDFTRQAEALGYTVRIATLDGENLAGDANYIPTRLNIRIDNGIVTGIYSID